MHVDWEVHDDVDDVECSMDGGSPEAGWETKGG